MADEGVTETTPTPAVDPDLVTRLVDEVKASNVRVAEAIQANAPAPVDPTASRDETLATAVAAFEEDCSNGNYGEGLQKVLKAVSQQPAGANASDPTTLPSFIALAESARDRALRTNDSLFKEYGSEIDEEIKRLPAEERITDAGIRKAVNTTRAAHADDLIQKAVDLRLEEAISEQRSAPPQHLPMAELGEAKDTDLHGLDQTQRRQARALRIPYAELADQMTAQGTDDTPGPRVNKDGSIDILPRTPEFGVHEPGTF